MLNNKIECGYTQFFFSFCSDNSLYIIEMFHSGKIAGISGRKIDRAEFFAKIYLRTDPVVIGPRLDFILHDFNNLTGNSFA